jgi:hypothetical protein
VSELEKPKDLIVKITLDDSEYKSKLNDIEKQFDRIIEKQKQVFDVKLHE